jgi:hypothetical protein
MTHKTLCIISHLFAAKGFQRQRSLSLGPESVPKIRLDEGASKKVTSPIIRDTELHRFCATLKSLREVIRKKSRFS